MALMGPQEDPSLVLITYLKLSKQGGSIGPPAKTRKNVGFGHKNLSPFKTIGPF